MYCKKILKNWNLIKNRILATLKLNRVNYEKLFNKLSNLFFWSFRKITQDKISYIITCYKKLYNTIWEASWSI